MRALKIFFSSINGWILCLLLAAFAALRSLGQLGATVYSDELTAWRAGRRQQPNIFNKRFRGWTFASLPAGNIGDVLVCAFLRKGERVLIGNETHSALSSGAGTATGSYGTYFVDADGQSLGAVDDADRFLAATSMEAAGNTLLATTQALFCMWEATADFFIVCVNSVEAFATAGVVKGFLIVGKD